MTMRYGTLGERLRWVSSFESPNDPGLAELDRRMCQFYAASDLNAAYHGALEAANAPWDTPMHRRILDLVQPGHRVVEFSCGSGYSSDAVERRGARYSGFDLPVQGLVTGGAHRRLTVGTAYSAPFRSGVADVVFSLYALEHVVWPHKYLDEMLRVAKPGGRLVLAFPDYLDSGQELPSVRLGSRPGGLGEKLRAGRLWDAMRTCAERYLFYRPLMRRMRRTIIEGKRVQFPVYVSPSCLVAPWRRDTDAIYHASEEEVVLYLTSRGCAVETRSVRDASGAPGTAKATNAFIVVRVGSGPRA